MFSMLLLATHLEHLSEIYCFTQPQDINQNPDVCVCVPFYFQISIYISQKLTITREPGMKLSLHFGQRLKITFNL